MNIPPLTKAAICTTLEALPPDGHDVIPGRCGHCILAVTAARMLGHEPRVLPRETSEERTPYIRILADDEEIGYRKLTTKENAIALAFDELERDITNGEALAWMRAYTA
jgi:hypothetical protein